MTGPRRIDALGCAVRRTIVRLENDAGDFAYCEAEDAADMLLKLSDFRIAGISQAIFLPPVVVNAAGRG